MGRFGVGAFLLSVLLNAPVAHAAPTCSDLFSASVLSRAQVRFAAPNSEIKSVLQNLRAPQFQKSNFDSALEKYRSTDASSWSRPRTREEKLALVEVMAEKSDYNPFAIEDLVSQMGEKKENAKTLASMANSLGRMDLNRGFSPVQIETMYLRLYNATRVNPRTVSNLRKLGIVEVERELLRQWAEKELASRSFPKAVEKLGFLRAPNAHEKFVMRMRQHPNLVATINGAAVGIFQTMLSGYVVTLPTYSKLASTRITPELRDLMLNGGFDAAYPRLKAQFGKSARFDHAFFWARRAATTALMGVMLFNFYPSTMSAMLPAGYAGENANAVELTQNVITYYSEVVVRLAGVDSQAPAARVSPMTAPMQLNDGAPASTDPVPVAIAPIAQEEPSANHPIPQNVIDAAEAAAPAPEANPEELEQLLKDLDQIDFSETAPS